MNDAERVRAAIAGGIRVCGENRVQELLDKYEQNAYEGLTCSLSVRCRPIRSNI